MRRYGETAQPAPAAARRWTAALVALLAFWAAGSPETARAQGVQVRVVDSTTMLPLSGALVALLDSRGAVVAEALSSQNGFRIFLAPAGRYRVRVRRIGYRPYLSGPVDLFDLRAITVAVQSEPVVLSSIVISARSSCRSLDSQSSQALGTVWGEATKALEASRLTLHDLEGVGRAWLYTKTMDARGNAAASDTVHFRVLNRRPFGAIHPDTLASEGYVVGGQLSGWSYYGPDETVLLAGSFARTHCFRLVRDVRMPGAIGVTFEPVRGRKMADIAGVAWLDETTSELRRIVFRYVNAGDISRYGGRGETRFRRVPSGAWLISSWYLRVPTMALRSGRVRRIGFQEIGGGLLDPP